MKTSELTGAALDWAVAKCEKPDLIWGETIGLHHASYQIVIPELPEPDCYYRPSTDWAQAGPIIEREKMWLSHSPEDYEYEPEWTAQAYPYDDDCVSGFGETALIAAMRCYVASKLGDDIDIPEELS